MARPYRLQAENCFYHITSRGNERKKIYEREEDYKKFLEKVKQAKDKYQFYLYAYVLMPNHYHLLVETPQANLSKIMQTINSSYTTYFNRRKKRYGHLFQGRYKSIVVDRDSYYLELSRYIHLNPVRAKMLEKPEEYRWSSFNGYITKNADGYIDKAQIEKVLDMKAKEYREFVYKGIEDKRNPLKEVYGGFILGTTQFIKEKLRDLKEPIEGEEIAYSSELSNPTEAHEIIEIVSRKYGNQEFKRLKNRPSEEKKIAIYLVRRYTGLTNKEIGKLFDIGSTAVIKAANSIEKALAEDHVLQRDIQEMISAFSG